jgi:hypothetical protein
MDSAAVIIALVASGGVLAGAVIQGILWLWDKTDHRFRTALIHFLIVLAVVFTAEKMAVDPLYALQLELSPEIKRAGSIYNQGLRSAATLMMLVPFGKWAYEFITVYVTNLRKAQQSIGTLSWGEKMVLKWELALVLLPVIGIWYLWYFTT